MKIVDLQPTAENVLDTYSDSLRWHYRLLTPIPTPTCIQITYIP